MSKIKRVFHHLQDALHNKGLVVILLLAFLLRLPLLSGSLWLDEAAQALESSRPLNQQHLIVDDFQPPLFHYLVHFWLIFSKDEMWLRSISLLSGLVTIAALYLMLAKVSSRTAVALAAGLLLAINPFHIFFSQELRPYSLATMFAVLSWWALLAHSGKLKANYLLYFIVATIGGLYSMYIYPLILLSQILYVAFEKRIMVWQMLVATCIAVFFFLPWMPFFLGQLRAGTGLTKTLPGWSQVVATPQLKALPLVFAKFIVGQVTIKDSRMVGLAIMFVVTVLVLGCKDVWRKKEVRFLLFWLIIPVFGTWLTSFFIPVIQPKRLMVVLPAMMGILGYWVLETRVWLLGRRVAFVGIVIVSLIMAWLYFTTPAYQREDWRGVIATIARDARDTHGAALFTFPESFAPWRWYADGHIKSFSTGKLRVESVSEVDTAFQPILSFYPRVYVFDYLRDLSDPGHKVTQWLTGKGYQEIRVINGGNVGFVRVYSSL